MEFFDGTVRSQVQDFLHGKNALVFSYGVTNAGKTHTIQGMKYYSGVLQLCKVSVASESLSLSEN